MVRTFRFSTAASRVDAEDDLTFDGAQTRLGAALDGARQELAGLPLAGLVVVSDGADTAEDALGESLLALKSQGVPVFTVGVGRETLSRDIQIGRVSTPRIALKGTTLMIDVMISQTGFAGKTVTLDVEDEGRIVGSQQVKLPERRLGGDGARAVHRRRPRPARVPLPRRAAGRRAGDREQRSRGDDRRPRPAREDSLLRGRAAATTSGSSAAPSPTTRTCSWCCCSARPTTSTSARGVDSRDELVAGFPEDARGAVLLSRHHPRQHRGRRVHRRSAADDRRVRRSPRRRPADARRRALVLRRRLRRHRGRRRAAAGARSQRARAAARAPDREADARRRGARRDADRRDRSDVGREVEVPRRRSSRR